MLSGGQDFCPEQAGSDSALHRFGIHESAYYKEFFSAWFVEMYNNLQIAHKLLLATATLKIVKLLFCAF